VDLDYVVVVVDGVDVPQQGFEDTKDNLLPQGFLLLNQRAKLGATRGDLALKNLIKMSLTFILLKSSIYYFII
jgi:hypothetical protein